MKKLIYSLLTVALTFLVVPVVFAKPATDTCTYLQDGTLQYELGHNLSGPLTLGFDPFGYNYQAHLFEGNLANAYLGRAGSAYDPYTGDDAIYLADNVGADAHWAWQFRNVSLQMKWNDAWLANKDCTNDGKLDRSTPYQGSGAWLTNHAAGTYTKSGYNWNVTQQFVVRFDYLGLPYDHDLFLTDTNDVLSGNGGYVVGGPYSYTWDVVTGSVSGDIISINAVYTGGPDAAGATMQMVGTIAADGSMSGTWQDNYQGGNRAGTWSTFAGNAEKTYATCEISDFVKIIAPPSDAYKGVDNIWYTVDGYEIGPDIWGEFAIIQEKSSDPCGEYGEVNYLSPLKKGLGNW
jgi:hypothetical protein